MASSRRLIDVLPEPFVAVAVDSLDVIEYNEAAAALFKKSGSLDSSDFGQFFADGDARLREFLRLASATGSFVFTTLTLKATHDRLRVEGAAMVARDANTEPVVLLRFSPVHRASRLFMDLNHKLEDFNRMNRGLEAMVTARTQELADVILQLQQADRFKSEFLAMMSHELRTPLNSIIGFSNLMLTVDMPPADRQKQLRMIASAGEHLLSLISELLDVAKLEAGLQNISISHFSLSALIEEVIGMVTPLATKKGLELKWSVVGAAMASDRTKIRQILLNLLSNAIKFTDRGQICLDSRVEDDIIWLRVADSGTGITMPDRARLFQPFTQLGRPHAPKEGTGLGLYVCRLLAERLGGTVELEDSTQAGSTFSVRLPTCLKS
jgi:signal transduction histidine kinase